MKRVLLALLAAALLANIGLAGKGNGNAGGGGGNGGGDAGGTEQVIAYVSTDNNSGMSELRVMDEDGQNQFVVADQSVGGRVRWSPGGDWLLFREVTNRYTNEAIACIRPDGTDRLIVVSYADVDGFLESEFGFVDPDGNVEGLVSLYDAGWIHQGMGGYAWAADGLSVVFNAVVGYRFWVEEFQEYWNAFRSRIFTIDLVTGEIRLLTEHSPWWEDDLPDWSWSLNEIVFVSDRLYTLDGELKANRQLWTMRPDGSDVLQLTASPTGSHSWQPRWSRFGDPQTGSADIVATLEDGSVKILSVMLSAQDPLISVVDGPSNGGWPAWSRGDDRLIFRRVVPVNARKSANQIVTAELSTGNERVLFESNNVLGGPDWKPAPIAP